MRIRTVLGRLIVAAVLVAGVTATTPTPSGAAGVTTHGWMAVSAIPKVTDPQLRALLAAHEDHVRAGGMFPDAGYLPGLTFGEEAHWQRFIDAYTDQILARDDCGDITDPNGPCATMVAHLMGVAAHGMGDEVWDWLFEPYAPDLNEYYTSPSVSAFNETGAESQMDVIAVGVHGVPRPVIPQLPSIPALIAAFDAAGLTGVTPQQFALQGLGEAVWDAETGWVTNHLGPIQAAMPWMSANMVTAPGGVDWASTAIAGYWESIWGRLRDDRPATRVSITYPAPGQDDLPTTGWDRASFQPGTARGRGGARNRITAALTSAMPYRHPGGPAVSNELAPGTMTIRDRATGAAVPVKSGYPRLVPYGADSGEHLIDVQPAANLAPCHWYDVTVGVDTPLVDDAGETVTPYGWSFRTECTGNALTGTVTGPDGQPVGGAWVLAYRPGSGYAPTGIGVTGPDGNYVMTGLPAHESYRVGVLVPAESPAASGAASGTFSLAGSPIEVDLALAPKRSISGRVTNAAGDPIAGVAVSAFGTGDTWVPGTRTTTAADGTYRLVLPGADRFTIAFRYPADRPLVFWNGVTRRQDSTPIDLTTTLTVAGIDQVLGP